MKNTIKLFGIITLVAVIGFSMIACDSGLGGTGGTGPTSPTGSTGGNGGTGGSIGGGGGSGGGGGIIIGGGKFVAVGGNGKTAWSADGVSWAAIPAGTATETTWWYAVAYGNGKFVVTDLGNMAWLEFEE